MNLRMLSPDERPGRRGLSLCDKRPSEDKGIDMKTLINQTRKDLRVGYQSWRVISLSSVFSVVTTIGYMIALNS
jgi:hypothetical protein